MLFQQMKLVTVKSNHSLPFFKVYTVHLIVWKFWIGSSWLAILLNGMLASISLTL